MPELRVGWIGLGIMGRPMATNLVRAGFEVVAWNRSRPRAEAWVREGARLAGSPRGLAAETDVVFTMLSDTPDVESVLFGREGVFETARAGQVIIDASTISPAATRVFAARFAEKGVALLDAPVSGGEGGATAGTLSIMVGGDRNAFERCRPLFSSLGKRVTWMGPSGSGQTTKLCNQVLVLGTLLSVCEGISLARASGLDVGRVLEALGGGAAGSWQLEHLGPRIAAEDFTPGFLARLARKDLRLVLEAAGSLDLPLPGVGLVQQLFSAVDGEAGTQALFSVLERLSPTRRS